MLFPSFSSIILRKRRKFFSFFLAITVKTSSQLQVKHANLAPPSPIAMPNQQLLVWFWHQSSFFFFLDFSEKLRGRVTRNIEKKAHGLSRNNNSQAQARRFPALTAPEPEFPVIFGSKWDPLTSAWRQGGASSERVANLRTGVSPLQKRIWMLDFYHCSSCNFFFHICFCHLWCELPL